MRVDSELVVETLTKLEGDVKGLFRKPSSRFVAWLKQKRIPAWLRHHLVRYALARDVPVGVIWLYSPRNIRRWNDQYPIMTRRSFLQVGSTTNGDPVVIRYGYNQSVAGYLSCDELWTDEPGNPEEYFLRLADSLGRLVALAVQIEKCPLDYYGTMVEMPKDSRRTKNAGSAHSKGRASTKTKSER
jgi:hypothetical protein